MDGVICPTFYEEGYSYDVINVTDMSILPSTSNWIIYEPVSNRIVIEAEKENIGVHPLKYNAYHPESLNSPSSEVTFDLIVCT